LVPEKLEDKEEKTLGVLFSLLGANTYFLWKGRKSRLRMFLRVREAMEARRRR
jgi:hypothetical protein